MTQASDTSRRVHRFPIMLSEDEMQRLDDWRFANRIATRADAARRLIDAGPEMMEALKGILSNPGGRCTAEQWQAGLRALAKAEGRT